MRPAQPFSVSHAVVHPALGRIVTPDRVVHVEPRVMDVLIVLAHASPEPVSRDELLSRMRDIFEWLASGQLKIRIGHVFPMADASRAHEELEARRTTGKVLLTM